MMLTRVSAFPVYIMIGIKLLNCFMELEIVKFIHLVSLRYISLSNMNTVRIRMAHILGDGGSRTT